LLKLYLRELPEPLFQFDLYDKLIEAQNSTDDTVSAIAAVLQELHPHNKALLRCLL